MANINLIKNILAAVEQDQGSSTSSCSCRCKNELAQLKLRMDYLETQNASLLKNRVKDVTFQKNMKKLDLILKEINTNTNDSPIDTEPPKKKRKTNVINYREISDSEYEVYEEEEEEEDEPEQASEQNSNVVYDTLKKLNMAYIRTLPPWRAMLMKCSEHTSTYCRGSSCLFSLGYIKTDEGFKLKDDSEQMEHSCTQEEADRIRCDICRDANPKVYKLHNHSGRCFTDKRKKMNQTST